MLALLSVNFASATSDNCTFINGTDVNNDSDADLIQITDYSDIRETLSHYQFNRDFDVPCVAKFNIKNSEGLKSIVTNYNQIDSYDIVILSFDKGMTYNINHCFNTELLHPKHLYY